MKQKQYRLFSNILFVARQTWGWNRGILLAMLVNIPCQTVLPTVAVFAPAILLRGLEAGLGAGALAAIAAGLAALLLLLTFVRNRLDRVMSLQTATLSRRYDLLLSEKVMRMDFALMEGPRGRDLYQKAKNSLESRGVYNFWYFLLRVLINLFGLLGFLGIIAILNPWILVILLGSQGFQALGELWLRRFEQNNKEPIARVDRRLGYMRKSTRDFAAGKDIRLFRMELPLLRMSRAFMGEKKALSNRKYNGFFVTDSIFALLSALLRGGVYVYLVHELVASRVDIAAMALYLGAVMGFAGWLEGVNQGFNRVMSSNNSVRDMREFLDLPEPAPPENPLPLPNALPPELRLRAVGYTYPGAETPALKNIDLTIAAGERLAIVGRNGAGKTTLVKMLCGLYRPDEGQITLAGEDLARFHQSEYFTLLSCVFQDIRMMPVPVAYNISCKAEADTDLALAEDCLRQAGLWEKIESLPLGLFTPLVKSVNEDGVEFSGGELQRLALARAIYKGAPILILDEPTAALDAMAEEEMYLRYNALTEGKTAVYVSHRLSSTRFCDRIIYLEDGGIIESGTHEELIALGGRYAHMFEVQSHYYRTDALRKEAE